ncbi:MAG: DUF805 domain-containing protein, partial [Bacilli bacterium]|nr:DUF805 domain-containing protein [Bacilli bacterium]
LLGLAVSFFLMICEMLLPMAIVSVLIKVAPVFNVIVTSSFIVRRCHDLDKSGYWGLLVLIPIVNFFFLLYLLFAKGTEGWNQYGRDPLEFDY